MNRGTNTNVNREQYEQDLAKIEREKLAFEKKQEAFEEQKIKQDYESGIRNGVYDENMPSPLDMTDIIFDPKLSLEDNMLINGYTRLDLERAAQDLMLYMTLKSLDLTPGKNSQAGGAATPDPKSTGNASENSPGTPTGPMSPLNRPSSISVNQNTEVNVPFETFIDKLRNEDLPWYYIRSKIPRENMSCKEWKRVQEAHDNRQMAKSLPKWTTEDERRRANKLQARKFEEHINLVFNFIREEKIKNKEESFKDILKRYSTKELEYDPSDAITASHIDAVFKAAVKLWEESYKTAQGTFDDEKFARDRSRYQINHDTSVSENIRRHLYRALPDGLNAAKSREEFMKLGYNVKEWQKEWDYNHSWNPFKPKPVDRWPASMKVLLTGGACCLALHYASAALVAIPAGAYLSAVATPAQIAGAGFFAAAMTNVVTTAAMMKIAQHTFFSMIRTKAEQRNMDPEYLKDVILVCTAYINDTQEIWRKMLQDAETTSREAIATRKKELVAEAEEKKAEAAALKIEAAAAQRKMAEKQEAADAAAAKETKEAGAAAAREAKEAAAASEKIRLALEKADKEAKEAKDKLDLEDTAVDEFYKQMKSAEDSARTKAIAWRIKEVADGSITIEEAPLKAIQEEERIRRQEMRSWCTNAENRKKYVRYLGVGPNNKNLCDEYLAAVSAVPAAPPPANVPQLPPTAAPRGRGRGQGRDLSGTPQQAPAAGGAQKNLSSFTNNVESQITPQTIQNCINILNITQKNTIPEYVKNYIFNQVSQHVAALNAANNATQSAGYRKTQKRTHRKSNMRKTRSH